MKPVRSRDIRESNEKLILRLIRNADGISQSEVVAETGLRAPTVLRFFSHLEEEGYIRRIEREPEREKRGRKPVYFEPIPESAYAVGMEFWAYSVSMVITDFAGNVVFSDSHPLNPDEQYDVIVMLQETYSQGIKNSGIDEEKILGLCVAAPGQIDVETGELVQYSRLGVADISLKKELEAALNLPVAVQNNSAAVAWDEYSRGAGREASSLFMIMIRAGVGGAFLDNGDIFVSKTGTTLEVGHIAVEYDGRPCDCGSRGCLETYLSEGALISDLQCCANPSDIDDVDALLSSGRPDVEAVLQEKARMLALAVRNLISLFGPEMFLIVSRSPKLSRFLAENVHENIAGQSGGRWQGRTVIESAVYDPVKAGRGAADLVYKNFFTN